MQQTYLNHNFHSGDNFGATGITVCHSSRSSTLAAINPLVKYYSIMPRQKKSKNNDGKAASIPSRFSNEDSQDEDSSSLDPECWDYWKNFALPDEHAELFPARYYFLSDVLAGKASFKMTDLDESAKRKICLSRQGR